MQLPLTAVLLLFELTHDYFIIIPTLASVGISYWVASFPLASVLEPLSPLSRLLPSASSSASISASQVLFKPHLAVSRSGQQAHSPHQGAGLSDSER